MRKPVVLLIYVLAVGEAFSSIATSHHRTRSSAFLSAREQKVYSTTRLQNGNNEATDEETCWNPKLRRAMGAIATAGAIETAYLTYTELTGTPPMCGVGGSCGSILNGPYAFIPGTEIPIAAAGFVAYSGVVALALGPILRKQSDDEGNRILLTAWTTAMGVFSIFLMTLLFGVLKETCVYCVASAVFSIVLAKLSWLGGALPRDRSKEGAIMSVGSALASTLAAVILFSSVDQPVSAINVAGELVGGASSSTVVADSKLSKSKYIGQAPPPITTTSSPQALALADDLQSLDTRFFGAFWCSHCYDQKVAFGREAMAKIPYIECSKDGLNSQAELCKERKVPGYPTWEINGKLYPGEQALEELEEIVEKARK